MRDFQRLRGAVVAFEAIDIDETATLAFEDGRLKVRGGVPRSRTLTIRGDTTAILELSNLAIGPLGLPVYVDSVGRQVLKKLVNRSLRVDGLLRHPDAATRLTRIFSVR